ncbi:MAG: CtkA family protein, partial [Lachnospiraceae bacterium]|nr:CtkA family protein [Lachnospiraceae bacterium]
TPFTEPIQREFYQVMIRERKEKILDYSIEQLMKLEKQQDRVQEQEPPAQTM